MGDELIVCVQIGEGSCDVRMVNFSRFSDVRARLAKHSAEEKIFRVVAGTECAYYVTLRVGAAAIPDVASIIGDDRMEDAFIGDRAQYAEFERMLGEVTTITAPGMSCVVM